MFEVLPWKQNKKNSTEKLRQEIDNMYDQFFEPTFMPASLFFGKGKWAPKLDVSEGKKDITIKAEIPGMNAKDFDVTLGGKILTIRGQKKDEQQEKDETFYRVERSYGYFCRTVELPAEVTPDKVEAAYKKGILKIKLRKTTSSETKRIKISS
jgi:HSP20 family protein